MISEQFKLDQLKTVEALCPETDFDLNDFFSSPEPRSELLSKLQEASSESIQTLTANVTNETFAKGLSLTSNVFSMFGSIVGSCGVFCAHSLNAVSQVGSSLTGSSSISSGLTTARHKNQGKNLKKLSFNRASADSTGSAMQNFSADSVSIFSGFSNGLATVFGFGLIDTVSNCLFDFLLPQKKAA